MFHCAYSGFPKQFSFGQNSFLYSLPRKTSKRGEKLSLLISLRKEKYLSPPHIYFEKERKRSLFPSPQEEEDGRGRRSVGAHVGNNSFSFFLHLHAGKRSMHSGKREKKRCVEERASPPPPPPPPPVAYWEFPPPFPSPLHLL